MKNIYSIVAKCPRRKSAHILVFLSLIFFFLGTTASAQKIFSGIVTDSTGTPLPNVSVQVKGSKKAVATDRSGKFSI